MVSVYSSFFSRNRLLDIVTSILSIVASSCLIACSASMFLSRDIITVIAKEGMIDPVDVHVKDGDVIVLPLNHNRVFVFDAEGNCIATVQLNSDQVMRDTYFFTVNRWGYILVSSRLEGCIKTFHQKGEFIRETGRGQANDCYGVSMTESDGIVCVANASNNGSIQIYY